MSGHKRTTVTISQEEYRRLYEAEMLLKGYEIQNPVETNQASEEAFRFLNDQLDYTIQRQEQFIQLGVALNRQVSAIENQTSERIRDLEYHLLHELQQNQQSIHHVVEKFEENLSFLENQFRQAFEDNQQFLWQLQHQSNEFLVREEEKSFFVQDWLNDCIQIYNFILENYPESYPFIPELQNIQFQLDTAIQNFQSGFFDSALSLAQAICFNLSTLRVRLEKEGLEKRKILTVIISELSNVREELENYRNIKPIDLHGNILDTYISVDEWTGNSLYQLETSLNQLIDDFRNNGIQQKLEDLKDFLDNQIPSIKDRLRKSVHQARLNALNAHLNYLIAHDVLLALIEQGYKPIDGCYEPDEIKDRYIAKAVDPLGNLVEIQVQTGSPEKIEHNLHILSTHSPNQSLHELRQRAKEIQRSLRNIGWVVDEPVEIHDSSIHRSNQSSIVQLPTTRKSHL